MNSEKKWSTYDLVVVGVMAAAVFVATFLLKIGPIPTPGGPTQLKMGNALCLLGGLLFGGLRGGLAAGIGSALFDLTNPAFVASAPFTLVFFFMMGFVCGKISHLGDNKGQSFKWNLIGAIAGSVSYMVLHFGKSILTLVLSGSTWQAAVVANTTKYITSGINSVFAVVVSLALAPVMRTALKKAGIYEKIRI